MMKNKTATFVDSDEWEGFEQTIQIMINLGSSAIYSPMFSTNLFLKLYKTLIPIKTFAMLLVKQ